MKEQLKLENQLCFRLYTASRLITQAYHPLLSRIGLTYPQYLVMMVLWEQDGQPVNVTPLLKRMEAEGFVSRERGVSDARQVIVRLTEKGRELESKAASIPFDIAGAVACRSITEKSAPALYRTLDDLISALSPSES